MVAAFIENFENRPWPEHEEGHMATHAVLDHLLHPSRPVAERVVEIRALNSLHDDHLAHRDLMLQVAALHQTSRTRST